MQKGYTTRRTDDIVTYVKNPCLNKINVEILVVMYVKIVRLTLKWASKTKKSFVPKGRVPTYPSKNHFPIGVSTWNKHQ